MWYRKSFYITAGGFVGGSRTEQWKGLLGDPFPIQFPYTEKEGKALC